MVKKEHQEEKAKENFKPFTVSVLRLSLLPAEFVALQEYTPTSLVSKCLISKDAEPSSYRTEYLALVVISLSCLNQETVNGREPDTLQSRRQEPPTTLSAFRRGFVKNGGSVRSVLKQSTENQNMRGKNVCLIFLCSELQSCFL